MQACLGKQLADVLRGRHWAERLDRGREAHGENPPGVQYLTQLGVVQGQLPRQRVDRQRGAAGGDSAQGVLHFIDQGHHRAGSTGIPDRQRKGEKEARGGLSDKARLAAKLRGAVALAFANGGKRGIIGIDNFTLGQGLAVGEPAGLGGDLLMSGEGCAELGGQAPLLVCCQVVPRPGPRSCAARASPTTGCSGRPAIAFPSGAPRTQIPSPGPGTGGQSGA